LTEHYEALPGYYEASAGYYEVIPVYYKSLAEYYEAIPGRFNAIPGNVFLQNNAPESLRSDGEPYRSRRQAFCTKEQQL